MICTKCGNEGVKNSAMGKEFYYCRTCKEEITLSPAPSEHEYQEQFDFFFQDRSVTPYLPLFRRGDLVTCIDPALANSNHHQGVVRFQLGGVYEVVKVFPATEKLDVTDGAFTWYGAPSRAFKLTLPTPVPSGVQMSFSSLSNLVLS